MRRVVITGVGLVSGNGTGAKAVWDALLRGEAHRSRIADIHFDPEASPLPYKSREQITMVCGSPLTNDELANLASVDKPGRHDRHQLLALLAAKEALGQSDIILGDYDPTRFGIAGGTGDGGLAEDYAAQARIMAGKRLDPFTNVRELPNIFAGLIANTYGFKGPSSVDCTACAASLHALQRASDIIMLGRADLMMVVGAEAAITQFGIGSFAAQRALSNFSRPYQKDRDGFLMGEGAAALVVEEYEHAKARGAIILAEIVGYGATTDGVIGGLITDPSPEGGARAAMEAMKMARIGAHDIAYISTHGTGTPAGDQAELDGIAMWAPEPSGIVVSALKSYSGHLLGAAGAYAVGIATLSLMHGKVLPTYGLTQENLDPALPKVTHVMGQPQDLRRDHVLVNAFGFGGTNASVILRRCAG